MSNRMPSWQIRRSEFNHDWLSNKYLNSLRAFLRRLSEPHTNAERLFEFIQEDLPQWRIRRRSALELVRDLDDASSPRAQLEEAPLSNMDQDTKNWLGPLVHALWLARLPIRQLAQDVLVAIEKVDQIHRDLSNELRSMRLTDQALRERAAAFASLMDALTSLSTAFSRLPQPVG